MRAPVTKVPPIGRRELICGAGCIALCGCAQRAGPASPDKPRVVVLPAAQHDLAPGEVRLITTSDLEFALARGEDEQLRALSLECPHSGCTIRHRATSNELACPCHGSRFDAQGRPLDGPAAGPLTVLPLREEAGSILVEIGGPG